MKTIQPLIPTKKPQNSAQLPRFHYQITSETRFTKTKVTKKPFEKRIENVLEIC